MLKLKTFVKKTRRGKILKVVREHYLRDDLSCGVESCTGCRADETAGDSKTNLAADPKSKSDLFPNPHYIILVSAGRGSVMD
jgi:exosome complex exonuclease DIS3/RRP44